MRANKSCLNTFRGRKFRQRRAKRVRGNMASCPCILNKTAKHCFQHLKQQTYFMFQTICYRIIKAFQPGHKIICIVYCKWSYAFQHGCILFCRGKTRVIWTSSDLFRSHMLHSCQSPVGVSYFAQVSATFVVHSFTNSKSNGRKNG